MAIDVEERHVAMQPLADDIRHVAEGENIPRSIHRHSVIKTQALPGVDFVEDWLQTRIINDGLQLHRNLYTSTGQKDVGTPKQEE